MKVFKFSALLMLILIMSGCNAIEMRSRHTNNAIEIDGKDTNGEWDGNRIYCNDEEIILGFQHDEEFLYVLFISKNEDLERQMLMSGYTLWTNSKGKTKKETGLKFPALDKDLRNSEMAENSRNSRKRGNNDLMEKMNEKLNLKPEMLNYVDSKDREIVLSLNEIKDFDFARSKDTRGITYEFKIPYHEAGNRVFTCDAKGDKPVVLGIECEAPEMPEKADRNAGMSGGRGSGDGMGRGGGRGGAGGSMGEKPSENGQSFKDYMFWVKLDMNSQE